MSVARSLIYRYLAYSMEMKRKKTKQKNTIVWQPTSLSK